MRRKGLISAILATSLSLTMAMTAFAGQWIPEGSNWKWQKDDGTFAANEWLWIDDNGDGIAKRYCFKEEGTLWLGSMVENSKGEGYTTNGTGECMGKYHLVVTKGVPTPTGFLKPEILDLLGKDAEYVKSKLGQPVDESEVSLDYADGLWLLLVDGIVVNIDSPLSCIANVTQGNYTTEELSTLFGMTASVSVITKNEELLMEEDRLITSWNKEGAAYSITSSYDLFSISCRDTTMYLIDDLYK